ncbi:MULTISPECIES: FHA domain-containing protein [unclassified Nocardioides]|uniref:FHA domain-containing protein n=1 Tax=unclassified Nocardioides TaxID=2615069 RepID=UPI000056FFED|nr:MULTISPECIES: FHA domain-containing protein [unclassified Nocardioides]ABL83438.1 Forkhead-associated protein [Nocardioides sp. JS614]
MSEHATWSVRGGDWFGVFGAHLILVLPPSEKARVAGLWELVDDGAGFDETLDALISGGLRDLPGFVLVDSAGDRTRMLLRGAVRVDLATADDVVHLDGDPAATWVERTLTGVTRVRIEVGEEAGSDELAVAGGLVRLAVAEWPPVAARPEVPVAGAAADPVPDLDVVLDVMLDDGPLTEAMPVVPPGPTGPAAPLLGADHDGLTRAGEADPGPSDPARPGIPGQPPAPPVTARPVARLLFSGGEHVDVDRLVLVGRAPEPRRHTLTEEPRLVAVRSPHHEVSSTHLEIRPGSGADHGSAVVTDLGSTNGTLLVQPGLPPEDLHAGVPVQLIPGAVIDLGDGVTIRVLTP